MKNILMVSAFIFLFGCGVKFSEVRFDKGIFKKPVKEEEPKNTSFGEPEKEEEDESGWWFW
ncbi:MAG: hypothetical protein ACLFUW_00290 [Bacteroidales bacterium]